MTSIIQKVRTSFTKQLTLWVASFVTVISAVVIGLLALFSQDVIFDETVDTTLQALENTALRIDNTLRQKEMSAQLVNERMRVNRAAIDRLIEENGILGKNGIMDETELVTNFMARTVPRHLTPDSLLAFSRRAIEENDFLTGLAISMEPDFFPEMGRYYSAYSLRGPDSITTVREGPFEYFEAVWYKTPRSLGTSCWVDAYDDYNESTLSSPDILTSYCCPMRDAEGRYVGSITASLTLKWLSASVSALKPYPNSAAIMVGRDGTYLVHPDTAKLFRETIFSDAAPRSPKRHRGTGPVDACWKERHGRDNSRRPRRLHLLPTVEAYWLEHCHRLS